MLLILLEVLLLGLTIGIPLVLTVKAIKLDNRNHIKYLAHYWVTVVLLQQFQIHFDQTLSRLIPAYSLILGAFKVWLLLPCFQGCMIIDYHYVFPLLLSDQREVALESAVAQYVRSGLNSSLSTAMGQVNNGTCRAINRCLVELNQTYSNKTARNLREPQFLELCLNRLCYMDFKLIKKRSRDLASLQRKISNQLNDLVVKTQARPDSRRTIDSASNANFASRYVSTPASPRKEPRHVSRSTSVPHLRPVSNAPYPTEWQDLDAAVADSGYYDDLPDVFYPVAEHESSYGSEESSIQYDYDDVAYSPTPRRRYSNDVDVYSKPRILPKVRKRNSDNNLNSNNIPNNGNLQTSRDKIFGQVFAKKPARFSL